MPSVREIICFINQNQGLITFLLLAVTVIYVHLTYNMMRLQMLAYRAKLIINFEITDIKRNKHTLHLTNTGNATAYNIIFEKGNTKAVVLDDTPQNNLLFMFPYSVTEPGKSLPIPVIFIGFKKKKREYLFKFKYKSLESRRRKRGKY